MTTFAAIDFETANSTRDTACAIGVVVVDNGEVSAKELRLIRPPGNLYNPFNISIHGITPAQTENSPVFAEVWPEIAELIDDRLLIAHNAAFDISVLRRSAEACDYSPPDSTFACSYRIAKQTWPHLWSYGLDVISDFLGIELDHHKALSDANAAAHITLSALQKHSCGTVQDMAQKLGFSVGAFSGQEYNPFSNAKKSRPSPYRRPEKIVADTDGFDEEHPFYQRSIVITGTLKSMSRRDARQAAANKGANVEGGVNKSLDYLVVGQTNLKIAGDDGMSTKLRKAVALSEAGAPIEVISEVEFLELLDQ